MAVLSVNELKNVNASVMILLSDRRDIISITKPDLLAAITAMDAWIDANAASFNTAIPLPARTSLTVKQKIELFMLIVKARWEVI